MLSHYDVDVYMYIDAEFVLFVAGVILLVDPCLDACFQTITLCLSHL